MILWEAVCKTLGVHSNRSRGEVSREGLAVPVTLLLTPSSEATLGIVLQGLSRGLALGAQQEVGGLEAKDHSEDCQRSQEVEGSILRTLSLLPPPLLLFLSLELPNQSVETSKHPNSSLLLHLRSGMY